MTWWVERNYRVHRPHTSYSRPRDGRANPAPNQACIEFFARLLKVPHSSVTIASGHCSNKIVLVMGIPADQVMQRPEIGI
jgi:uncharacterized protein YggU (UPF0235/DUF167 family)